MADTLTAANVAVAGTGAVFRAVAGTTLPANADAWLPAAWKGHGYINADGVTQTISRDISDVVAWQNSAVVRKVVTSDDLEFSFTGIEENENMLTTYYGNYAAGTVEYTGGAGIRGAWVLDFIDGDDRHTRIVIPDGQVTSNSDVIRNAQGAAEYGVTITCYPDDDSVKAYFYFDDTPVSSE